MQRRYGGSPALELGGDGDKFWIMDATVVLCQVRVECMLIPVTITHHNPRRLMGIYMALCSDERHMFGNGDSGREDPRCTRYGKAKDGMAQGDRDKVPRLSFHSLHSPSNDRHLPCRFRPSHACIHATVFQSLHTTRSASARFPMPQSFEELKKERKHLPLDRKGRVI
ncbi:hypothetical protein MUK42_33616, partial [Musa troglodytarum]